MGKTKELEMEFDIMNIDNVQLIDIDLDIPDNSNELCNAQKHFLDIRNELFEIIKFNSIDDETHERLYESAMRVLDYVGTLSIPLQKLSPIIEDVYFRKYIHMPELAKASWLKHYNNIHREYNLIKNRCFKLLDEIDDAYIKKYKKTPLNWNP